MKIKRLLQYILFLAGSLSLACADAQVVVQASAVKLQPYIDRDQSGFFSCGVRAIITDSRPGFVDAHDFTLAIRADMAGGLIKAGKSSTSNSSLVKGKPNTNAVLPAPIKFWIAKEAEGKAISPLHIIAAETPGYILEATDLSLTVSAILAITSGERMQFANRYKNETVDTVIAFAATMPENERQSLLICLSDVADRLGELSN
ncbi:hypothetical protein JAB6_44300 [Janthinobacterium sp. HH104]|nr:hypothetical protein [Janthinobacterium sp. HH104]MDX8122841.1 hypothetical protein [Janthinobacterium sp. GMG2]OEZ80462.1 hypothetical protein JAB6_44300 [Janthinobacterium sp. HH104]